MKHVKKVLLVLGVVALLVAACGKKTQWPGQYKWGTLLPNRWVLTPAGEQIQVGDLPLNMVLSPNGSLLAVMNNGYSRQFISLIDTKGDSVVGELGIKKGFFGVTFGPEGKTIFASGGTDDQVLVWRNEDGEWKP
ncbi:MAG TPA: WD40 repeat domain-containing protein, partial [Bacteroidetes bacterium]|nr:WD40 repeat domain-containing protein [Bacteroidota bacterium]